MSPRGLKGDWSLKMKNKCENSWTSRSICIEGSHLNQLSDCVKYDKHNAYLNCEINVDLNQSYTVNSNAGSNSRYE